MPLDCSVPGAWAESLRRSSWVCVAVRILGCAHTLTRWHFSLDRANGTAALPGCFDIKAGIIQLLHAVGTLEDRSCIELLLTGDEELGSGTSRSLIEKIGRRSSAALILESAATTTTSLKVGCKGTGWYRIDVTGRAAHAGLEPEMGGTPPSNEPGRPSPSSGSRAPE